ncbi:MAG: hypothetical protein AB1568_12480 [Thermodesulfobacteriota bacterium]
MRILLYLTILGLFSLDWLSFKLGIVPRYVTWFPELAALVILPYVIFTAVRKRAFHSHAKYLCCIFAFLLAIFLGFVANGVGSGVMFSGMRIYLRYIPFFLLPAVWDVTEKELKRLLLFIFGLMILQLPVVLYQRFVKYSASISGDPMGGTLGANTSGTLSVLILLVLAVYISMYLKNRISFVIFLLGFAMVLLPVTMNETKITFVLLPVCFLIPSMIGRVDAGKIGKIILLFVLLTSSMFAVKTVYDHFQTKRWGYGITDFFQNRKHVEKYADARLAPIVNTLKRIGGDPVFFLFGVGAGNASSSFTGEGMSGKYLQEMTKGWKVASGIVVLAWEIGFVGLFLGGVILLFLFFDARKLSREDSLFGALGLGMTSVTLMFAVASLYCNLVQAKVVNVLFWLVAGLVVQRLNRGAGLPEGDMLPA